MTNIEAEKYVEENSYPLDIAEYKPIGSKLRCIDDRSSNSADKERDIAIPGSGLGLVMDVMGALTLLRRAGRNVLVRPEDILNSVEQVIGIILFHTDKKSLENHGLSCGGCGHLNGALSDPASYLLSESDAKYFIDKCLPELERTLSEKKLRPTVYEGKHNAKAVFQIESLDVGLPSVSESGTQVYVYHHAYHQLFLKKIGEIIFRLLTQKFANITHDEWESLLLKSAADRLSVTLLKLAHGLHTYSISKKIKITVEKV